MYDGIKSIYEESKVIYTKKSNTPILYLFRELLEKVPQSVKDKFLMK